MKTTTRDGTTIAWTESGGADRPVVILLHSLGADRDMWSPQVEALAEVYRVLSVDTRGHGRSDATPPPYGLDQLGNDVVDVADAAGVDRFHVCGLSLGGQMALWMGINHPDRVLSVVAANTGAKIGDQTSWGARIEAVEAHGLPSIQDAVIERWFSPDFASRHPDWHARSVATFARTDPRGYIGCCGALGDADLRPLVAAITAPTLAIGSTLDVSTPPEQIEWIHTHVPGSEIEIIDGAAHVSNLDRSDRFTERLMTFLDRT